MAASDSNSPTPSFDSEALARQGRFVRALARGLVHDEDAADELTARTSEAALVRRPDTGPGFPAWLKRVVGRLFRRDLRDRERRERRERAAARHEATPATIDLVAEIELQQKVTRAFESLEEPSKSALFLRYFHDRTPTEIAAALGVPLGTVKSRLQRGLNQLRERLDAQHEGRRKQWLAALVPWSMLGAPIVTTKSKLVPVGIAALLLAGASVVVFDATKRDERDRPVVALPNPAVTGAVAASALTSDASSGRIDATPSRARDPDSAFVLPLASGIVVDELGQPIPDVAVVPARIDYQDGTMPSVGRIHLNRIDRHALARTDADGRFAVSEMVEDQVGFHLCKEGFEVGEWLDLTLDRTRQQELRIVLRRGGRASGRLRDSEGRPIGFGNIMASDSDSGREFTKVVAEHLPDQPLYFRWSRSRTQQTRPRADGTFEILMLPASSMRYSINAYGYELERIPSIDPDHPLELTMRRNSVLVDAIDSKSKRPILEARAIVIDATSGAAMQCLNPARDPFRGNDEGFVPPGRMVFFNPRPCRIQVLAAGYRSTTVVVEVRPSLEPPHLIVELEPGAVEASLSGRVVAQRGSRLESLAGARVEARFDRPGLPDSVLQNKAPLASAVTDGEGRFEVPLLPPGEYRLYLSARGFGQACKDVTLPSPSVEFVLNPAASLEVVAVGRHGAIVPGMTLQVQTKDRSRVWALPANEFGSALFEDLPEGDFLAGACWGARYGFGDPGPSPWEESAFATEGSVTLTADQDTLVEIPAPERVHVVIHVRDDQGTPISPATIVFEWVNGIASRQGRELENLQQTPLETDSRGEAARDLFPGSYPLLVTFGSVTQRQRVEVPNEDSAEFEIRLPLTRPMGRVRGRVVELGADTPIAKTKVTWYERGKDYDSQARNTVLTNDEGRFDFERVPQGALLVRAEGHSYGATRNGVTMELSSHGSAWAELDLVGQETREFLFQLPPLDTDDPIRVPVEAEITVLDLETKAPVENAHVQIFGVVDGIDVGVGTFSTDKEGHARARVAKLESYSMNVFSPHEPKPPHAALFELERATAVAEGATLRATVLMRRRK